MSLEDRVRTTAGGEGADFLGIADVTSARAATAAQSGEQVAGYPRAVSIGIALSSEIVDGLADPPSARAAELYRYYCYDLVNDRLDKAALRIARTIEADGFAAFPVPAAPRAVEATRLCGLFPSKTAAHLAGLGWIGRSCLLVTPQVGPRVRWAAVLTHAPLQPVGTLAPNQCGTCRKCVDACPAQAFTGRAFDPAEPREARFDAAACNQHLQAVELQTGQRVCGLCVKVCPHGARRSAATTMEATA